MLTGNPTGTLIPLSDIKDLLEFPKFRGIVVVDEAYIDFAGPNVSAVELISSYANLCVMQTLSKGFGLAAIRLGMALAHPALITVLSNTKAPYNVSSLTADAAKTALSPKALRVMQGKIVSLVQMRTELIAAFSALHPLGLGTPLGGNDANFLLIPVLERGSTDNQRYDNERSYRVYKRLAEEMGVIVRYRGNEFGCGGCLRITVGTRTENAALLKCIRQVLIEE